MVIPYSFSVSDFPICCSARFLAVQVVFPIFSVIFQFSGVHFSYFTLGHRGPVPGLTPSAAGPQGCRFGAQWPPLSCVPRERDEISNIPDFCEVSLTWLRSLYTRITLSTSIHVGCICLHMCKQA